MSNASEYADSLVESIRRNVEGGAPFGYINDGYDSHVGSLEELRVLFPDAWEDSDDPEGIPTGWSEGSGVDYLADALDIQYVVSRDRTYRAARILIGYGGPNVWINTQTGQLEVAWGSALEYRELPSEFIDALDEACEEFWEMGA